MDYDKRKNCQMQNAPTSKIINISTVCFEKNFHFVAVCEDGSVWHIEHNNPHCKYEQIIEPFNGVQYEHEEITFPVRQGKGIA